MKIYLSYKQSGLDENTLIEELKKIKQVLENN
jgi:hypothetical protein